MKKEFIILDLDNTIYPVFSIGDVLFKSLFELIERVGEYEGSLESVKRDIMRKPFQVVASEYSFSNALTAEGIDLLKNIEYTGPIKPFDDYELVRKTPQLKFLVTTGFKKLQESKIREMKIEPDFAEIHIVDPMTSTRSKKDVFLELMENHALNKEQLLVIGDDPNSELKAAKELGIDAILYDKFLLHTRLEYPRIVDYGELGRFLE